jgi:hypothetical protein
LGVADAPVFKERAVISHWPHANTRTITFKYQPIPGANAQQAAHFAGHSDLPLTRHGGLFLHVISLLYHFFLT